MSPSNKIIRVEPADNWFVITWELGNRCNQSCCYCSPELHSPDGKLYSLEELQQFWIDIYAKTQHLGLKYKICFSGGEATIQKNFLPFLEWLKREYTDNIAKLVLTSNGTASADYYLRALNLIDNLSISVHSEYINEQKFFDKLIDIRRSLPDGKFLHVNVMNEPWNTERIAYYEQVLKDNDIYYSVNTVLYRPDVKLIPIFKGNLNFDISKPHKLQLRNNT
jgi:MoaA/NifB/PqqE/SkfB family radical SAM enzyme